MVESITQSFSSLSVKNRLFIDIFNFNAHFYTPNDCHWKIKEARAKVKAFVQAARDSGYDIEIFIDAALETEEAILKWKSRREKEILDEEKAMP